MAFKGGTPIQAGLGAANFGAIERGGQAMGQAYANVGQTLAGSAMQAIQTYRQKKEEKIELDSLSKYFESQGMMKEDVGAMLKGIGASGGKQLVLQSELSKIEARMNARKGQELAGMSAILPEITMKKENPTDPDRYDMAAGLKLLDERGFSDDAKQEFRLQVQALNDQADARNTDNQKYSYAENYVTTDGKTLTTVVNKNGQRVYVDPTGAESPIPEGAKPLGVENPFLPKYDDFAKIGAELQETARSTRQLVKFFDARGGAGQGINAMLNEVKGKVKTFFQGNNAELNPAELDRLYAEGKMQSLVGMLREEIVGPGVMTEQDAKRVEQGIGGSIRTGNWEVARKAISDIVIEKKNRYEYLRTVHGVMKEQVPSFSQYPTPEFVDIPDGMFNLSATEGQNDLPSFDTEEQARAAGYGKNDRVIIGGTTGTLN